MGQNRSLKIAIATLGCKVNFFDSAAMAAALRRDGFDIVPFSAVSDIYIINSCTVTESSDAQSRQLIRRALRMNPYAQVVVTGCYAQHAADALAGISSQLHILGNFEKEDICSYIKKIIAGNSRILCISSPARAHNLSLFPVPLFFKRTRAFLKIQDGCSAACSYCIVPHVRGMSRSLPVAQTLESCASLVRQGYREIVLTGIHLGMYGLDLQPPVSLVALLQKLTDDARFTGVRIRLSSIEPNEISDALVALIARSQNICPHLHIPLQSGDELVLTRMNRSYTPAGFKRIIETLTQTIPDLNVGVDVMAGFPGETEAQFEKTLRLVQELPVGYLHVFPYSRRPGTAAAHLPDQIPEPIKKQRTATLRKMALQKKLVFYTSCLNKAMPVLIEGTRDRKTQLLRGVSRNYIPVLLNGSNILMGKEIIARITGITETGVYGVCEENNYKTAS